MLISSRRTYNRRAQKLTAVQNVGAAVSRELRAKVLKQDPKRCLKKQDCLAKNLE